MRTSGWKLTAPRRVHQVITSAAIRLSARVSQSELAEALGVRRETVARWEAGTRTPADEHIDAYMRALAELARAAA